MTAQQESDPYQEAWLKTLQFHERGMERAINELAKYATIPVEVIVVGAENQAGDFEEVWYGQTND